MAWAMTFSTSLLSLIRYSINSFFSYHLLNGSVVYVGTGMVCMVMRHCTFRIIHAGVVHICHSGLGVLG